MVIGYFLALFIGLSLGLLGGGGSILTVPVLIYALKMDTKLAIALSLAIVGSTALIGSFTHWRAKNINIKIAMIFGPIAMLGTFIGAKISVYISGPTQLILFAIVMLAASFFMIRGRKEKELDETKTLNIPFIAIQAIGVGILTGIVGVGGGFLIVPALVLLANIPMKQAVGTSLFIIALNSFTGFIGYMDQFSIPWGFLATFILFTGTGIFAGTGLVKFVPQQQLRKVFAVFLIVMGSFILYKNRAKMAPLVAKISPVKVEHSAKSKPAI